MVDIRSAAADIRRWKKERKKEPDGDFWRLLRPAFPASRVQHVSDLHSKFALGPHHVSKYDRHSICDRWD